MAGSVGKQTQPMAQFSKPLAQKISPKKSIKGTKINKGLSFVLREPAPASAFSHRNIGLFQHGHLGLGILRTVPVGRNGLAQELLHRPAATAVLLFLK